MAQVVGGSDFDDVWYLRTNRCLLLLRQASDLWASKGRNALDVGTVLAAFLQVLAKPANPTWPSRIFSEATLDFDPPQQSCESCKQRAPKKGSEDVTDSIEMLNRCLQDAADWWALGDPENPQTKQVLDSMLSIMWNRHLAARPPSRVYPDGL